MLALVDACLRAIRATRTDTDAAAVLARMSEGLGFRSGYLVEYSPDLLTIRHIIDSRPDRSSWWRDYLTRYVRPVDRIKRTLATGEIIRFNHGEYLQPDDPLLILARRNDMVETTIVPVTYDQVPVGVVGFCGVPELSLPQERALLILVYSIFSQVNSFRGIGVAAAPEPLTTREREVITLSAEGLTSESIGERLGVAPRTVNQHVDNVARKLGTKNRTHTVAEVIRRNML